MNPEQLCRTLQDCDVSSLDDGDREALMLETAKLFSRLEKPAETIYRWRMRDPAVLSMTKVGIDIGLFQALQHGPRTADELSQQLGTDCVLLRRVIRCCSQAIFSPSIAEVDFDADGTKGDFYALNHLGKALAEERYAGALTTLFQTGIPTSLRLPEFLAQTGYVNPTDKEYTPSHLALGLERGANLWEARAKIPGLSKNFSHFMELASTDWPSWVDSVHPGRWLSNLKPSRAVMVDIGGAQGMDLQMVRKVCPDVQGRFILQDLPKTIAAATEAYDFESLKLEAMPYDFFTEQPIKGARIYFLGSVLHDWSDDACKKILERIYEAMDPEYSRLILHEAIISDRGANPRSVGVDIAMMALAGMERTFNQWQSLLTKSGFTFVEKFRNDRAPRSILEYRRA